MSLPSDPFNQAVQAARGGERARALELFLAYADQNKTDPLAWVWISELAGDRADRLIALEKALGLLPPGAEMHRKITARIDMLRARPEPEPEPAVAAVAAAAAPARQTLPFTAYPPQDETLDERFSRVKQLRAAGKRTEAIALVEETAQLYPDSERAWLALSKLSPDPLTKIRALEHALEINPQAAETARRLEMLRPMEKDALKRGSYLQEQG
jgi:tetratricopeptide (TPR) repeat protein